MKIMRFALIAICFINLSTESFSADLSFEKRVVQHRLSNGITLLLMERHYAPMVSIRMMFRVGSVDESSGKTGLAHMFEHMMFKGTKTWGTKNFEQEKPLLEKLTQLQETLSELKKKTNPDQDKIHQIIEEIRTVDTQLQKLTVPNELWDLYEREGAVGLNAQTSADYTQYTIDLPSNKLELWAKLDSDRLMNPVFRQFYSERDVVKEERRMRVDNDPGGKLYEYIKATAFSAHPYRTPVIGWEDDLGQLQTTDLRSFYETHYRPENLTIALVGDIQIPKAIQLVEAYFGAWKSRGPLVELPKTKEPTLSGPRSVQLFEDSQPSVYVAFPTPTYPDKDHPYISVLSQILATGTNSRLYKSLVEKKQLATAVEVYPDIPGARYPSILIIALSPKAPHSNEKLLNALESELQALLKKPIDATEIQRVQAAEEISFLKNLQSSGGLASALAYHQSIFGDWKTLIQYQDAIRKTTPEDIQRVARRYLDWNKRTVGYLETRK